MYIRMQFGTLDDGTIVNGALYEFRKKNRKTFKLGIKPIKKKKAK